MYNVQCTLLFLPGKIKKEDKDEKKGKKDKQRLKIKFQIPNSKFQLSKVLDFLYLRYCYCGIQTLLPFLFLVFFVLSIVLSTVENGSETKQVI